MEAKITNHLKSLGCKSNLNIALAYQVYIELLDVRMMYDVDFLYNNDMDIVYLTAKPFKNGNTHIFIPHSTSDTISLKTICDLQNKLCKSDNCVTLACVESDSTVVLYTFSKGLVNIEDPDYLTRHRTREERKDFLDNEIRKKRFSILMEAHNQSFIDDD